MEIERKDVWYLIGYMFVISIFVSVIIGGFLFEPKTNHTKVYLEKLGQEDTGYQICNRYINTWMFVCGENNTFWNEVLYNHTQNDLDNLIRECPTGTIEKWTYCIGDYLTVESVK